MEPRTCIALYKIQISYFIFKKSLKSSALEFTYSSDISHFDGLYLGMCFVYFVCSSFKKNILLIYF